MTQPLTIDIFILQDEIRTTFPVSMFGFLQGGILNVTVSSFSVPPNAQDSSMFKFTLDRTLSDATNPYLDSKRDSICIQEKIDENDHTAVARFSFDFRAKQ